MPAAPCSLTESAPAGTGRFVRSDKPVKSTRTGRAVGLLAAFVVSGLLHEGILG